MDRLIATNSVPAANADTAPVTGTPQYATDGNPQTNTPATVWPAYQYNAIQEELLALITKPGTAPDRTNLTQLFQALQTMFAAAPEYHTASGTSVAPVWATRAFVRVWGAGGGGGGTSTAAGSVASGGGGGGYAEGIVAVTGGTSYPVTVPAGGVGGVNGTNLGSGGDGGTASFGSLVSATGGAHGLGDDGGIQVVSGGGGAASGGSINMPGTPGVSGYAIGSGYRSGDGGSSYGSVRSLSIISGGLEAGGAAVAPGGGGGGGMLGGNGAAGANALVVVRYLP